MPGSALSNRRKRATLARQGGTSHKVVEAVDQFPVGGAPDELRRLGFVHPLLFAAGRARVQQQPQKRKRGAVDRRGLHLVGLKFLLDLVRRGRGRAFWARRGFRCRDRWRCRSPDRRCGTTPDGKPRPAASRRRNSRRTAGSTSHAPRPSAACSTRSQPRPCRTHFEGPRREYCGWARS